jgi:hypothetical protein
MDETRGAIPELDHHERNGLPGVLFAHYARGHGTRIRCQCGMTFCCSVSFTNHQAEEVQKWQTSHSKSPSVQIPTLD